MRRRATRRRVSPRRDGRHAPAGDVDHRARRTSPSTRRIPLSAGQNLTQQYLEALASNPAVARSTVFILTYDENGGFFDHVAPPTPPAGTAAEFVRGVAHRLRQPRAHDRRLALVARRRRRLRGRPITRPSCASSSSGRASASPTSARGAARSPAISCRPSTSRTPTSRRPCCPPRRAHLPRRERRWCPRRRRFRRRSRACARRVRCPISPTRRRASTAPPGASSSR
jgi:hypothetical protein